MQPKVELAKSRDFGEIINDTFNFIKQNMKQLVKNQFIFCGLFFLAGSLLFVLQQYRAKNLITSMGEMGPQTYESINTFRLLGVSYFIGIALVFIGGCISVITVLSYMAIYKQKGNIVPETSEVWGYIKYYFLRSLLVVFVVAILFGLGLVLCLIPGIYLFPIMGLICPVMIFENGSFEYSFSRAFQLIKDNWWVTAATVLVSWIIYYFMAMIVTIPISIVGIGSSLLSPVKSFTVMPLWASVVSVFIQQITMLFSIIPVITIALCYFNLSESKEGTSLLDRINKLGNNNTPQTDLPTEEY
ncbi:hypothetical protein ACFQZX_13090 [Mucilaginibacter litoreus]|uniref:Membrane domain of glycerophosphoryl diester phosphodiesterase n=1 Tax=Mucilaginibacter litoreus TaxID=1048221 RepID=A0ABW3AUN3_9SPHI